MDLWTYRPMLSQGLGLTYGPMDLWTYGPMLSQGLGLTYRLVSGSELGLGLGLGLGLEYFFEHES